MGEICVTHIHMHTSRSKLWLPTHIDWLTSITWQWMWLYAFFIALLHHGLCFLPTGAAKTGLPLSPICFFLYHVHRCWFVARVSTLIDWTKEAISCISHRVLSYSSKAKSSICKIVRKTVKKVHSNKLTYVTGPAKTGHVVTNYSKGHISVLEQNIFVLWPAS